MIDENNLLNFICNGIYDNTKSLTETEIIMKVLEKLNLVILNFNDLENKTLNNVKELDKQVNYYMDSGIKLEVNKEVDKQLDENILTEKVNRCLENNEKIEEITTKLTTNTNKIENVTLQLKNDISNLQEDSSTISNNLNFIDFEKNCLLAQCNKYESLFSFSLNGVDKSYFAITIDDCNEMLPVFHKLLTEKNVPYGASVLVSNLENIYTNYDSTNTKSIKEILYEVEANGGEVLAHYTGSPNDDTDISVWLEKTRDVKYKLTQEGFNVRGIIRADNTPSSTNKGHMICNKYFEYSDNLGKKNTPYYIGKRKMLTDLKTINDMKTWINTCCQQNGFYVLCVHGMRNDEPLATKEGLTTIIDYINGKSNTSFTTYSNIYDRFGKFSIK